MPPGTSPSTSPGPRRVTLSMVAREAELGVTTVSDILNRGAAERYSPQTQQRVRDAVARIGYTPLRAAQMMRSGRSHLVGFLLLHDFSNPYWIRLAGTLVERFRSRGYHMQLAIGDGRRRTEAELLERFLAEQVEGLIVGPIFHPGGLREHTALLNGSVPSVIYGHGPAHLDGVNGDENANGRLIGEHLLGLGHRRVAAFGDPTQNPADFAVSRIAGLHAVYAEAGLQSDPRWTVRTAAREDLGSIQKLAVALVKRWAAAPAADRPTAIFCHNDTAAIVVLNTLHEAGFSVPADVQVTGYDNLPESRFTVPALTTLDPGVEPTVDALVDSLLRRIEEPDRPAAATRFPGTLVPRASTRPLD